MTAILSIDLPGWMAEQLSQASPDLLRSMLQTFAEALMSADADAVCGASYGRRSAERINTRNGHRHRGGTPVLGRSIWRFRSCGKGPTFRSGCWSGAGGSSRRWYRWWRPATCSGCQRGGWRNWSSS